jgi:predicted ABC-type transport system involved in lysophospholipase L1 biosynthesis ATPase subunit
MSESPVIQASGLCRSFYDGERELRILRGLDLTVRSGETLVVLGRSGSGKSTLLQVLGLLDSADEGSYRLLDRPVGSVPEGERQRLRNREIGFVFQHYHLLPELTALENVRLPARVAGKSAIGKKRAEELLDAVGLAERMSHRPRALSGGEQQRVAIARALINSPTLLLCDEPTGNLDRESSGPILDLLFDVGTREGRTVVMVTHDEHFASVASRCVRLQEGVLEAEAR